MAGLLPRTLAAVVFSIHILALLLRPAHSRYTTGQERGYNHLNSLSIRGSKSVPVKPLKSRDGQYALSYTIQVKLGPTLANLIFDTGSNSMYVISSLAPSSIQSGHNVYTVLTNENGCPRPPAEYPFEDGLVVLGELVKDLVSLASVPALELSFGAARDFGSYRPLPGEDGLMGMGLGAPDSWLGKASSPASAPRITSFTFDVGPKGKNEVTFYDSGAKPRLPGETTWLPLTKSAARPAGWTVESGSHGVVLFDTGATFVHLTPQDLAVYFVRIDNRVKPEGAKAFSVLCSEKLPDLEFYFEVDDEDVEFVVQGSDLMGARVANDNTRCYIRVRSSVTTILGVRFMEEHIMSFDVANKQIGITKKTT